MPDESTPPAFTFRRLVVEDLPMLREWLARPHVAEWWGAPPTLESVRDDYAPALGDGPLGDGPVRAYVALLDGAPAGFVQEYRVMGVGDGWWPDETDPGARGVDQFLADGARLDRGLGSAMLRAFVDRLFADPDVTRVQADPSPANARAIRCYEKAGFHRVGHVDTPDGRALLMVRPRDEVR